MRIYKVTGGKLQRRCASFLHSIKCTQDKWKEYINTLDIKSTAYARHKDGIMIGVVFDDPTDVPDGWEQLTTKGHTPTPETSPQDMVALYNQPVMPGLKMFCASIGLPITHNTLTPGIEHIGKLFIITAPDDREPIDEYVEITQGELMSLKK